MAIQVQVVNNGAGADSLKAGADKINANFDNIKRNAVPTDAIIAKINESPETATISMEKVEGLGDPPVSQTTPHMTGDPVVEKFSPAIHLKGIERGAIDAFVKESGGVLQFGYTVNGIDYVFVLMNPVDKSVSLGGGYLYGTKTHIPERTAYYGDETEKSTISVAPAVLKTFRILKSYLRGYNFKKIHIFVEIKSSSNTTQAIAYVNLGSTGRVEVARTNGSVYSLKSATVDLTNDSSFPDNAETINNVSIELATTNASYPAYIRTVEVYVE